jgi:hypothetical protein
VSLSPGADISAVFNITEEQETDQVNEDKGEDKPGGCHSSPVPIFRLYLINTGSRRRSRSTRTRVKISQVGVDSSQVAIFRLFLINTEEQEKV